MHFSQKRELFLFPITTLLPSLIVRFLFVISLSVRATRTIICSFFVRLFFICSCGSHRLLFVLCSFFVRLLFVNCLSARVARTCPCGSHLLVRLALPIVLRPRIGFLLKLVPLRGFGGFRRTVTRH
ncbi:Uncharacterised protein [Capnocytophaga ochracea]|uniref:Uncharacterized protein n=1 Tax=Capnocytophaga ochracea TaxID=1018 RepID=A0A2X2SZW3_CAPOC|nr:Uncharacterised protein [Capnocytophaga ochracea]